MKTALRTCAVRAVAAACALVVAPACPADPVADLRAYLERPVSERPPLGDQAFSAAALSKEQTREAAGLLWDDAVARMRAERKAEWEARSITLAGKTMKFEVRTFGDKPDGQRALFISMHGGGGAPPAVNEQQWKNQMGLYTPREGVYVAPRAPTDAWNMWHEAHMDALFDRLIEDAVVFAGINPDRVYLMGYSAGGDGVYQLGPRMADRWAAAAMMAGHPNEASPVNLRNVPFSIQCGGDDGAFDRNKVCREWGEKLDRLREGDPQGYEHQCIIYEGLGHWMNRKDAQAVDWMLGYTRNPMPKRIVWRQDDVLSPRLYWVVMPKAERKAGAEVRASIEGQTITVASESAKSITLLLGDALVDLDRPVEVVFNGKKFSPGSPRLARTIGNLARCLETRGDRRMMLPATVTVPASP